MAEKYILLIEDNEDDMALTELAFKRSGSSDGLVVVWDGEEERWVHVDPSEKRIDDPKCMSESGRRI
jgi:hypothetical protein